MTASVDHEIARALRKQGRWAVSERQVRRVRKAGLLPPFSQGPGRGRGPGRAAAVSAAHVEAAAAALDAVRRTRSLDLAALDLFGQGRPLRPGKVTGGFIAATARVNTALAPIMDRLGAHLQAQNWERPDLPVSDDELAAAIFDGAELLSLAATDALAQTKWGKQGLRRLAGTSESESPEALLQSAVTNLTLMGTVPTAVTRDGLMDAGHLLGAESPETEVPTSWPGFPAHKPSRSSGAVVTSEFSVDETSRIIAQASPAELAAARQVAATALAIPEALRQSADAGSLTEAILSWPPIRRLTDHRLRNVSTGYIAIVILIRVDATGEPIDPDATDALYNLIQPA